jgi:hypothetical protein
MLIQKIFGKMPAWLAALLAFVVLVPSITNQSIDMDEAQTWDYVRLGTLDDFWSELKSDPNSESQMPLGMLSWWAWGQIWGTGEYAMRSLNFLWAAMAVACMAVVGKKLRLTWLPLLFAIQPFLWYSMDFARTPVMQMAGGALLLVGVILSLERKALEISTVAALCAGALILCGGSMLGLVPLVAVFSGLFLHTMWGKLQMSRGARILVILTTCFLLILGFYYATTLIRGAGGAKIWTVSPANALFVIYEFLGFQGLGPGRQELRAILRGLQSKMGLLPHFPGLFLLVVAYVAVFCAAIKAWLTRPFERIPGTPSQLVSWLMGLGVLGQSLLMLLILAGIAGFPFWGRHLAGAFPFWVMVLGLMLKWAGQGMWRKVGRVGIVASVLLLLLSTALIRLTSEHRHDDYRAGAVEAMRLKEMGKTVWWVADRSGGEYYGLKFNQPTTSGGDLVFAHNLSSSRSLPDAIIISRPDNFDTNLTATSILKTEPFRKTFGAVAFEVWEQP